MIKPVILCGGSGTRLWPLSRKESPKQFTSFFKNKTLFELTSERLGILDNNFLIVAGEGQEFTIASSIDNLGFSSKVILENEGKNTAPAMTLAAFLSSEESDEDNILLFAPADHFIQDSKKFIDSVKSGIEYAKNGSIVTFGVTPSFPSSAYGYIKKGNKIESSAYLVDAFIEKPNSEKAEDMFKEGSYMWNAGIFLCSDKTLLAAMKKHAPDIYNSVKNSYKSKTVEDYNKNNKFYRPESESFKSCRSESIDYALMEKYSDIVTIPIDCQWTDVGSWNSVANLAESDEFNNAVTGHGIAYDSKNTYINAPTRPVVSIGTDDLVIIDTIDAVLVAQKDSVEKVKDVVASLRLKNYSEADIHREVYRPWGKYDSIDNGDGFQVKRITVKPGQKLSVQMHYHRAEHWVVVSGVGRVHYGNKYKDLNINESTYHDKEVVHALENPGEDPLILIEVQVGSYLGEDDIVRYEDIYGRTDK